MSADPNNSIKVGGHSLAFGVDGSVLSSTSPNAAALPYADEAVIEAIPSTTRTDGMEVIDLTNSVTWIFDAESSAGASAWVLVPDAGSGRWLRKDASTADLASTSSGYGASLIGVYDVATNITGTNVETALAEIALFKAQLGLTTNTNGASKVAIEDASAFTTAANVEAALAELYQEAKSTLGVIPLAPSTFYLLTGAPLAIFANGTTTVPGSAFEDSKCFGVRWNNDAAPAAITRAFQIPSDMDITANPVVHVRAAKIGATNDAGNTTTFAVGLFNQVDAATYGADTDFGGASSALTPNATTKTIQNMTRTITASDLAAYPASVTITLKPTAGTLDTDDLLLVDVYVVYKRKLRTS